MGHERQMRDLEMLLAGCFLQPNTARPALMGLEFSRSLG
jgi:hypothetical protein